MVECDICRKMWGRRKKAYVDGALNPDGRALAAGHGWANMCKKHFKEFGVGLGIGKGRLISDAQS